MSYREPDYCGQYEFHPRPRGRNFWLGVIISAIFGAFLGWLLAAAL